MGLQKVRMQKSATSQFNAQTIGQKVSGPKGDAESDASKAWSKNHFTQVQNSQLQDVYMNKQAYLRQAIIKLAYNNPQWQKDLLPLVVASDRGARYEKGVPADPTENMSEEDAAVWEEQNELHRDEFKQAAAFDDLEETVVIPLSVTCKVIVPFECRRDRETGKIVSVLQGLSKNILISGLQNRSITLESTSKPTVQEAQIAYNQTKKQAARNDPYWLNAKFKGRARDGTPFQAGDRILYYPIGKVILVGEEAEKAWLDFNAHAADEGM